MYVFGCFVCICSMCDVLYVLIHLVYFDYVLRYVSFYLCSLHDSFPAERVRSPSKPSNLGGQNQP